MNKIIPTIGRVVWFNAGLPQPHAATVVYVWNEGAVNLSVSDESGNQYSRTSIMLFHGDAEDCPIGSCCWMPYQKQQAEKAVAEEGSETAG